MPFIEFVNYSGGSCMINPNDPTQIDRKIRELLSKKILKQDDSGGYLYVLSSEATEGAYKVGCTHNLPERIKGLKRCYGVLKLLCFVECPNVDLFEKVVHAELLQYRLKHPCPKHDCKLDGTEREHTEWFKADLQDIFDTVTTWSLYARMLYRCGLSVDRNNHSAPLPGASSRADRWRRWALLETGRWMDGLSSNVSVVPEKATPEKNLETDAGDETDSECESIFSSPADRSGTPGTTPATTPGFDDHEKDDYSLSPIPAEKCTRFDSLEIDDDDEDDLADRPRQPVERTLFVRKESSPTMQQKDLPSDDLQSLWSARNDTTNSDTGPVPDTSPTNIPSSESIDNEIRSFLDKNLHLTEKPGTIYLTKHTETESYKIYFRKKGSPRKSRECYTKLEPCFEIECTNTRGIQDLVLAEFTDWKKSYKCRECGTAHNNWINAPREEITASLRAWTELVEVGYDSTKISSDVLSQGADRWTRWAREAVAKSREDGREARNQQKEAQDDKSSSVADGTSAVELRQIPRNGTGAASESSSKDRGRGGRVMGEIIRRLPNLKEEMASQGSDGPLRSWPWAGWLVSRLLFVCSVSVAGVYMYVCRCLGI
ncbi:hypothetical protein BDW75DRAFT_224441 [Aspergillus navahoensis]